MRLIPSDPDIQTLVQRINDKDINLQPDFQRGEVWTDGKKRRLIDSILREWHVPPIHVVEVKESRALEVLDGQQRLVAIRDFVRGKITVDGSTEPFDDEIFSLHGKKYLNLPIEWKRRFDQFTIRLFKITDYKPEEPGELFFRLNQPTALTSAEQRNAFFGPTREQIKMLVRQFENFGLNKDVLGFSNSRMAFDDIISKVCYTLEVGTLHKGISATDITNKYRSQDSFSDFIIDRVSESLQLLGKTSLLFDKNVRFNKATLYSWICFIIEVQTSRVVIDLSPDLMGEFIMFFELLRNKKREIDLLNRRYLNSFEPELLHYLLINIFNDRASSRVADVLSVTTRDLILWIFFRTFCLEVKGIILSNNTRFEILDKWQKNILDKNSEASVEIWLSEVINKGLWGSYI